MKTFRIMTRFWLIVASVAVGMTMLLAYGLYHVRANMVEDTKSEIINLTQTAVSLVNDYRDRAASGELSEEEAKARAAEALATYRFGDDGYFYAFDKSGTYVVHPMVPELVGQNKIDLADPNGVKILQEMRDGRSRRWDGAP